MTLNKVCFSLQTLVHVSVLSTYSRDRPFTNVNFWAPRRATKAYLASNECQVANEALTDLTKPKAFLCHAWQSLIAAIKSPRPRWRRMHLLVLALAPLLAWASALGMQFGMGITFSMLSSKSSDELQLETQRQSMQCYRAMLIAKKSTFVQGHFTEYVQTLGKRLNSVLPAPNLWLNL